MAAELTKDLAELESLRRSSQRPNVQKRLDDWINECNLQLEKLKIASKKVEETSAPQVSTANQTALRPYKKLTTYALDESDKYIKLYYTLPGIQNLPADRVVSKITNDAFDVRCLDVNGVDYEISAKGFLHGIDHEKSSVKQKSDLLLVMLKKQKDGETWGVLLKLEKSKEKKMPEFDDKGDPQESMMKLMKQMYDEGDDEMKRNIRKTWHESQSKKTPGGGDFGMDM